VKAVKDDCKVLDRYGHNDTGNHRHDEQHEDNGKPTGRELGRLAKNLPVRRVGVHLPPEGDVSQQPPADEMNEQPNDGGQKDLVLVVLRQLELVEHHGNPIGLVVDHGRHVLRQ